MVFTFHGNCHLLHVFKRHSPQSFDLEFINACGPAKRAIRSGVFWTGGPGPCGKKSHIPQSRSFSWEDYTGIDEKKDTLSCFFHRKKIARALAEMGITENTPIVAYGDAAQSWGGEAWICWVLTWLGHKGTSASC